KGYLFASSGTDTYEVSEIEKDDSGTEITLFLRENDDDFNYDKFLDEWEIKDLVKKYSDYVRYPIRMNVKKQIRTNPDAKEDEKPNYEERVTLETLNSMTPIWKKPKSEITDEELNEFYKQKYYDYEDPQLNLLIKVEGNLEYTALI